MVEPMLDSFRWVAPYMTSSWVKPNAAIRLWSVSTLARTSSPLPSPMNRPITANIRLSTSAGYIFRRDRESL